MSLHQDVGLYCQHVFPSLSIFSNCSLILACLASGCPWMASWTRVTNVFKLKEKGFPNCPNPVCTSGNTLRTHTRVIVAGRDGNSMFGCEIIKRVVQVSVLVAQGCLGSARSRLSAAVLRLQDGGLRVFRYHVLFHVNWLHLQGS